MKVLLRHTVNGWYYQGPSKWTRAQEDALDLGQAAWAVDMVFKAHLENVEILLCYDDPRHNLVLSIPPLPSRGSSPESEDLPANHGDKLQPPPGKKPSA